MSSTGSADSGIDSGIAPELAAEFDISLLTWVFLIKRILTIAIIAHGIWMRGLASARYNLPCAALRSVSLRHPTVNREVRHHGAGNRPARRIRRRPSVRGSAGNRRAAGEGMHRRHGGGDNLRQRLAVEPDRHPLRRTHR